MRISHLLIAVLLGAVVGIATAAEPEGSFRDPPDTARPWVYWTCQDGHYSVEGVTADFEAMANAGIGGVIRMDCNVGGIPFGGTPYLSETWRDHFVHAVRECERLGLEFTTITGPGWSGSGGPWIKADQSMQHLVPATVTTKGPARFNQILPLPEPRISRYHRKQTPQMRKEIGEFHKDVAVFAFPRREPLIEDVQEKALFIRNPFTSMRGVRPHLPSPVSYPAAKAGEAIDPTSIIDLTGRLQEDGRLLWDVPPGEWTIVRLAVRSTGANTRPAPAAGLGLESDKFSKKALQTHFASFFDPLLKAIGPRPTDRKSGFVGLDADSWEMSSQNWTPGFREEFRKRCGYDPRPYFACYTGCVVASREQTERFLWDVRKVCQEMLLDNHAAELKKLCHERGLRLMIEPYDMNPAGDLDLGSYADFPAGEFWLDTFKSGWSCIEAASVAHTMGRPIVLAESFTCGHGNWQRAPWALKKQGDWAFALGINKFAIHGFAHQTNDDAPGMTFGPFGLFWNRKQTFWPLVGGYHKYLARCSYLLQQGAAVSDILYLTPEGAPQVFLPPPSALNDADSRLPDKKGYGFDGCSPRILMRRAEVSNGLITFPGGTSYRLMVLPDFPTMTPQLLSKIRGLVQAGATVLGSPPVKSPSLSGYPKCDEQLKALAVELWGGLESPGVLTRRRYGRGAVYRPGRSSDGLYPGYDAAASVLKKMGITEDFVTTGPVRYGHRRTAQREIYFLSNKSAETIQADCTVRVGEGQPQLWDPVTGTTRPLPQYSQRSGRTTIPMAFEPYQSFFVVFSHKDAARTSTARVNVNFPKLKPLMSLAGPWEVSFDPRWGGPAKISFDALEDWTHRAEDGVRHYSGIAVYRKTFDSPKVSGRRVFLDLGVVHEVAGVVLNGKELGVVWCAPWRIDITDVLKGQGNQLEIKVANLWTNRLLGDAEKPAQHRLTRTVLNYRARGSLKASGLLGPVRLTGIVK